MKRLLILLILLFFVPPSESWAQCTEEAPCPELARLGAGLGGGVPAAVSGITLVGSATVTEFTATADWENSNFPAGVQANDILIAVFAATSTTPNINSLTGWTQIGTTQDGGTDSRGVMAWRLSVGAETEFDFTDLWDASTNGIVVITAWRGVNTTTPIHKNAQSTATTDAALSGPTITPTVNNCVIIQAIGCDPTTSAYASTDDADPDATELFDAKQAGSETYIAIQYYLQATAAEILLDYDPDVSDSYFYFQIALLPS